MRLIAKVLGRDEPDAARPDTTRTRRTNPALLLIAALLSGSPVAACAEEVELALAGGLHATAEYLPGEPDQPAVLVLHGFMQTRHYLTVSGLVSEVHDNGFTVLAPTLSLGIDRRKQSLACEAIHAHDLDRDITEIGLWVDFLKRRGHRSVLLVGHSSGSMELLAYVRQFSDPALRGLIATSLIGFNNGPEEIEAAKAWLAEDENRLRRFPLGFCLEYTTTPSAFLSYAGWDKTRLLAALKQSSIPVTVVMGAADRRMDADWPSLLRAQGVPVYMVEGANHFFSGEQEFALYDQIIPLLSAGNPGR